MSVSVTTRSYDLIEVGLVVGRRHVVVRHPRPRFVGVVGGRRDLAGDQRTDDDDARDGIPQPGGNLGIEAGLVGACVLSIVEDFR